jgi:hypothetical protein
MEELHILFARNGSSPSTYNLPPVVHDSSTGFSNRLIDDEMSYDVSDLLAQAPVLYAKLNPGQRLAFDSIVSGIWHSCLLFCVWLWRYRQNLFMDFACYSSEV